MAVVDPEREEAVVADTKTRLEKPPLYKVLLHNDDYTSMDFVVFILRTVFQLSEVDSVRMMLQAHPQAVGTAGGCTYEIAEATAATVTSLAQEYEYPLLASLEAE